jgi:hypothetical protein
MATAIRKTFASPDQAQEFPNARVESVELGDLTAVRSTFHPGWRWTENIKPVAHTDSCQVHHVGYQLSGRLGIRLDDGTEVEYGPGDAYDIPPGHDGWVIGDEPVVMIDFRT